MYVSVRYPWLSLWSRGGSKADFISNRPVLMTLTLLDKVASTSIRKRAKKQTELTSHGRQHPAIVFTGRCLLLLTNKKEM